MIELDIKNFKTTDELIDAVNKNIEILSNLKNEIESINATKCYETIGERFKSLDMQPKLRFNPTGLTWLDNALTNGGLAEGVFINIAGASGAGKTFLSLKILEQMGQSQKVAYFSYEMNDKILYRKLRFSNAVFRQNCFFIDKNPFLDTIADDIFTLCKAYGVKFFVIDSRMKIQLRKQSDEYLKNLEISAKLSQLCRELGVTIMLINQRSNESLKVKTLMLKGGNEQVYDSDMIFYIEHDKDTNERLLICDKDRLSEQGKKWKIKIPDYFAKEPKEIYFEPRADLR